MRNDVEYQTRGLAIVNPYGGVWTPHLFNTPDEAWIYLKSFWKNQPEHDLSKFKLAEATLTVKIDRPVGEPDYIELPR